MVPSLRKFRDSSLRAAGSPSSTATRRCRLLTYHLVDIFQILHIQKVVIPTNLMTGIVVVGGIVGSWRVGPEIDESFFITHRVASAESPT
jgi:hypothetical protein